MAGLVPQITLFTPDYRRVAPINFFESLKLSLKWNGLSTLELVVSGDHSRLDGLTRPGARLVVDYGGGQIFSGPVRRVHGVGPWRSSHVTIMCEDDIRLLWRMLMWPVPYRSSIIGMEWRANRDYAHYSGAAESVAKKVLRDNTWRFPPDIFMVDDKSRGRYIKDFQARFHVFADKLLPVLSWARMTVTVKQFENVKQDQRGLLFDCVPAVTREHVLTAESGSIVSWEYVRDAPKATAVVVGAAARAKIGCFVRILTRWPRMSGLIVSRCLRMPVTRILSMCISLMRRSGCCPSRGPRRGLRSSWLSRMCCGLGQAI